MLETLRAERAQQQRQEQIEHLQNAASTTELTDSINDRCHVNPGLPRFPAGFWRHAAYEINAGLMAPVCYETAPCINGSIRRNILPVVVYFQAKDVRIQKRNRHDAFSMR